MVTVFGKTPLNEVIRAKRRYRWEPSQYGWYFINEGGGTRKTHNHQQAMRTLAKLTLLALLS